MSNETSEIKNIISARRSRRTALRTMGLGALGVGAVGLMASGAKAGARGDDDALNCLESIEDSRGQFQDSEILNFALNLEYLEAQFYSYATTGGSIQQQGVAISGSGTEGTVTIKANPQVPFAIPAVQQYAKEVATDELNHVKFLRAALTAAWERPVAMPSIDLLKSFTTAARAAGVISSTETFDPFANDTNFLIGAYIFEDVGVTAYHGAAALLANKSYLTAAAGIMGTEAYHASLVRTVLYSMGSATQAITAQISALRAALDGTNSDDHGVVLNGNANIVDADSNSLVFARTTRQVLNIVYGSVNTHAGLFYPDGMNGSIR